MIDKIEARLKLKTFDLEKLESKVPHESGPYFKIYKFENVKIKVYPINDLDDENYVYISGSIPKFLYKNNLHETDILMIKRFVVLLTKMTGMPIKDFGVTALEIGANMNMSKQFMAYANTFEYARRFSRSRTFKQKGTLALTNASKTLILYDKGKEYIERQHSRGLIPLDITLTNLIRFEVRINKYVSRTLPQHTIADLYKKENFLKLVNLWEWYYFHIQKTSRPELKYCTNVSDIRDFLTLKGLQELGGKDEFLKLCKSLNLLNKLSDRNIKSLNNEINKALKSPVCIEKGEEVIELDKKVRNKRKWISRKASRS